MAWIKMSGGGGEKVKEFKTGTGGATELRLGQEHLIADANNFTVGASGKMILDLMIYQNPGPGYIYTITLKHNGETYHQDSYSTNGGWYYHFEFDVQAGDTFIAYNSVSQSNLGNCGVATATYKII